MRAPASRSANALPENHGHQRENGTERTSAIAVTPALVSKAMKRSAERFEWPMVRRSNDIAATGSPGAVYTCPSPLDRARIHKHEQAAASVGTKSPVTCLIVW